MSHVQTRNRISQTLQRAEALWFVCLFRCAVATMVAISLYRGNLHRVPDVPRRWPMPKHRISLRDFKLLVRKRSKALSRLLSHTLPDDTVPNPNRNTNPNLSKQQQHQQEEEGMGDNDCSKQNPPIAPDPPNINGNAIKLQLQSKPGEEGGLAPSKLKEIDRSASSSGMKTASPGGGNNLEGGSGSASKHPQDEKTAGSAEGKIDEPVCLDVPSDQEKRKRELEKNLHILNEKKHQLVQALKQILNAEEEIKKRNSIQMSAVRAAVPLQMESTDTASVNRHAVPKVGPEGNIAGDLEGESQDVSNHNSHANHLHHMRSTSPSAASPLRRPVHGSIQHNMATLTGRTSFVAAGHSQAPSNMMMGVMASPSRFAPSGHQGHVMNLPPVSVSGAHFIASSPSPVASGGTSVFRDGRLTSPSWN